MLLRFYATIWDAPSCVLPQLGPMTRLIARRGAFTGLIASGRRPALRLNHDPCLPLDARELRLAEDATGLRVEAAVADDQVAALLAKAVRLGQCHGASYNFHGLASKTFNFQWQTFVREVYRVDELIDVSISIADRRPAVAPTRFHVEIADYNLSPSLR